MHTFIVQSAANSDELFTALGEIDIAIPTGAEASTAQVETWAICRLLSTLNNVQGLSFPVSIRHRDRPDFLITTDGVRIGVEATRAILEQYAAYSALADREFPDKWREPGHVYWDAKKLSPNDMRQLLSQTEPNALPWIGDQPAQGWARFMLKKVDDKLAKLKHSDFEKFDFNWLSICDDLLMPEAHLEKGVALLSELLQDRWSSKPTFDTIYIERGSVIVEMTAAGANSMVVHDLWG